MVNSSDKLQNWNVFQPFPLLRTELCASLSAKKADSSKAAALTLKHFNPTYDMSISRMIYILS